MPTKTKETSNTTNEAKEVKKTKKTAKTTEIKEVSKKSAKTTKKANATKKSTTSKLQNKTKSVKKETQKKKPAKKSTTTKKVSKKEQPLTNVVEYYDLPYRYNETVVKILYQTPDTLFVYWDISDKDRENYIKQFGENFFNITRPVLIIHNDTMNYSFEIPINDFANSWYLHINDSKCNYRVELGRRPNHYNTEVSQEIQENIHTDYIYVSSSNNIESPNDHVLFNTNENNTVKFRNVKNNSEFSISLFDIVKQLPEMKKSSNIPYISEEILQDLYKSIYQNEDIRFFDRISNPSSGNPSSGSVPVRNN